MVRRARGLTIGYGAAGEALAIVGANGCGKTTLLRALAGLLAPRAGSLTWPLGAPPARTGMPTPIARLVPPPAPVPSPRPRGEGEGEGSHRSDEAPQFVVHSPLPGPPTADGGRGPDGDGGRGPEGRGPEVVRRARGLTIGYGAVPVLRDLDLDVVAGQALAIVGANGCGKTTLLRALAGLLAPRAGSLTWPLGAPPARTGMLLSQDEGVAPFRVRELVTLGLGRDGPPAPAEQRRVDDMLAELGLTALAQRPCAGISGGEWQRARLARALVSRPPLLLFDEPTNHLDPAGRAQVVALCARLRTATLALVLATHDLDLAARCDRVLLLADGATIACGAPADVLTPRWLARALRVPMGRHFLPGDAVPVFRAEVSP